MQRKLIIDHTLLDITLERLCQELIENHGDFDDSVIIGLQPRGIYVSAIICEKLSKLLKKDIEHGVLDITFHRDDFRRRQEPIRANSTQIPFLIEDRNVIIVDDVLFTGRSIRAAMDAMAAFGRPRSVELLTLIDRRYTREFPIQADYIGKEVNSMISQKVLVEWKSQGAKQDQVWLLTSNEE